MQNPYYQKPMFSTGQFLIKHKEVETHVRATWDRCVCTSSCTLCRAAEGPHWKCTSWPLRELYKQREIINWSILFLPLPKNARKGKVSLWFLIKFNMEQKAPYHVYQLVPWHDPGGHILSTLPQAATTIHIRNSNHETLTTLHVYRCVFVASAQ